MEAKHGCRARSLAEWRRSWYTTSEDGHTNTVNPPFASRWLLWDSVAVALGRLGEATPDA